MTSQTMWLFEVRCAITFQNEHTCDFCLVDDKKGWKKSHRHGQKN